MRKFWSYGPVDPDLHFYVPRQELIQKGYLSLVGETRGKLGHYITVWAPRQTGKTWIMDQVLSRIKEEKRFDVVHLALEHLRNEKKLENVLGSIARGILCQICQFFHSKAAISLFFSGVYFP